MQLLIGTLIVLLALLIYYRFQYKKVKSARRDWVVAAGFENSKEAANLLDETNITIIRFLKYLRDKYHIDRPTSLEQDHEHEREDLRKIIAVLLDNYDPDVIKEHRPLAGETSYTRDKGTSMHLCLRHKDNSNQLVDKDVLLFVVLHEISHIAAYFTWDHTTQFWEVFKFILEEAVESGIYHPVDYSQNPQKYCGIVITHNPLFDNSIRSISKSA